MMHKVILYVYMPIQCSDCWLLWCLITVHVGSNRVALHAGSKPKHCYCYLLPQLEIASLQECAQAASLAM